MSKNKLIDFIKNKNINAIKTEKIMINSEKTIFKTDKLISNKEDLL